MNNRPPPSINIFPPLLFRSSYPTRSLTVSFSPYCSSIIFGAVVTFPPEHALIFSPLPPEIFFHRLSRCFPSPSVPLLFTTPIEQQVNGVRPLPFPTSFSFAVPPQQTTVACLVLSTLNLLPSFLLSIFPFRPSIINFLLLFFSPFLS